MDRERVIKALEKGILITESVDGGWVHITIEEARKALELLREGKDGSGEGHKGITVCS